MSNTDKPSGRVELPVVTIEEPTEHISLLLIKDGLAQVDDQLAGIEQGIADVQSKAQQLNDQMTMHQSRKIAVTAQKNLLLELQKKITELGAIPNPVAETA